MGSTSASLRYNELVLGDATVFPVKFLDSLEPHPTSLTRMQSISLESITALAAKTIQDAPSVESDAASSQRG
jgi:hypothetical protein